MKLREEILNRRKEIKSAYQSLGKSHGIYEGQMLGTTRIGRFILKHVWRMTREEALEYQAMALEMIPQDFDGKLLEVPVGTGVLSLPVFRTLSRADIICLDDSHEMMRAAKKRAEEYVRVGFFTPPFETLESLRKRLSGMYSEALVRNVKSIAVFQCRK